MKKLALLLSLVAVSAWAQPLPPVTTPWSRDFLRQTNGTNAVTAMLGNTNYVPAATNYVFVGNSATPTNWYATPVPWTNLGGDYFLKNTGNPAVHTNVNGQFGTAIYISLQSGKARTIITNANGDWVAWSPNSLAGNLGTTWPWGAGNVLNTNFATPTASDASYGTKSNILSTWTEIPATARSSGVDLAQTNRMVRCFPDGSFIWGGTRYATANNSSSCGIAEAMSMLFKNTISLNGGNGGSPPNNPYGNQYGGDVYLESGQFNISKPITVTSLPGFTPPANARCILTIQGTSRNGSTICNSNGLDKVFNISMNAADTFTLRHLTVCESNYCGDMVYVTGAGSAVVEDCCFAYSTNGFNQGLASGGALNTGPTNDIIGLRIDAVNNMIATVQNNDFIGARLVVCADHAIVRDNMFQYIQNSTYDSGWHQNWPTTSPFYVRASIYFLDPSSGVAAGGGQTFYYIGNNRFINSAAHYFFGNSNRRTRYIYSDFDENGVMSGNNGYAYVYTTGAKLVFLNAVTVGSPTSGGAATMTCYYNSVITDTTLSNLGQDYSLNWNAAPYGMVNFLDVGGVDSQAFNPAASAASTNAIGSGASFITIGPPIQTNRPPPTPSYPGEMYWYNSNGVALFLLKSSGYTWNKTNLISN